MLRFESTQNMGGRVENKKGRKDRRKTAESLTHKKDGRKVRSER